MATLSPRIRSLASINGSSLKSHWKLPIWRHYSCFPKFHLLATGTTGFYEEDRGLLILFISKLEEICNMIFVALYWLFYSLFICKFNSMPITDMYIVRKKPRRRRWIRTPNSSSITGPTTKTNSSSCWHFCSSGRHHRTAVKCSWWAVRDL